MKTQFLPPALPALISSCLHIVSAGKFGRTERRFGWAGLLVLVLTACSSGSKDVGTNDSTAVGDTLDVPAVADEATLVEAGKDAAGDVPADTSKLEITFDETAGLVFERQEPYYTVSIVTQQYEASSEVTWYFDAEVAPLYFKESWSAEGNEGATEFFMDTKSGNVACAYTEEADVAEKWCGATGGIRTRLDDETGESTVELIPAGYGAQVNGELTRYLDILKRILNDAEKTQEDETTYTLRIEKTTLIGEMEVQESTEVSIPKKVYEALVN